MNKTELNEKQLDYVEACAIAVAVGLASDQDLSSERVPAIAFDMAEGMLAEREKRYGKIESDSDFR